MLSQGNVNFIQIDQHQADQRIDNFLLRILKGVPRSCIYRLLRQGQVRIDKKRVKPHHRLQAGELLRLPPLRMASPKSNHSLTEQTARRLEASVIYEDERLLVINKPSGLAVHGGTGIYSGAIELLRVLRPDAPVLELVHRLDKETSGCLMVAKKRASLREYHAMLRDQAIKKTYLALAYGKWRGGERLVSAALQKRVHSSGERIVCVNKNGKPAQTRFKLKQQFDEFCLLQMQLLTGRTHQIRVHAAYIGYPIAGDNKYGCTEGNKVLRQMGGERLFLHAWSLKLPTQQDSIVIKAPLCTELQDLLLRLQ